MRIITCASYFGTGSSAVTDLISEFHSVCSLGKYEYRFIQDPDGIADLEYHLIENNHRHNTSDAIKRYLKFVRKFKSFGYGGGYKLFGESFHQLTEEYISDITELKTRSWWHRDRINKGELFCYIDRAYSLVRRLFNGGLHTEKKYSLLNNREWGYFSAISDEQFLAATRKYIDKVIGSADPEGKQLVMVDQLVPPTNTDRYVRYFHDVKIIVVERDPRDVYLYEKSRYQWGVVPTSTVEEYVEWFKITRRYSNPAQEDMESVLRIRFEDLIYHYEETALKIMEFTGLKNEDWTYRKQKFNPERSVKNTNLKEQIKGYEEDIAYIERELQDYLYPFEA